MLEIHAALAPDAQMPAVRAFQVLAAVAEHGDVLRSTPAEDDVDGFTGRIIEVLLATDQTAEAVAAAVRAVPDVGDARVVEATTEPVDEPAPLAAVEDEAARRRRGRGRRCGATRPAARRRRPRRAPSTGPSASTPRAWTSSCT